MSKQQTTRLRHIVKQLPKTPGVYRFLNAAQETLYVGKAKNLAKRVSSYFRPTAQLSPRTIALLKQVTDIAYTEVDSELEAIILETNFIKELQPKYNILMRDDKSHLYLKITLDEDFPRVYRVRNPKRDAAKIYGPFTSAEPLQMLEKVFRRSFPYRTCHLDLHDLGKGKVAVKPKTRQLPCLLYHIKRCLGPCIAACSKQEYQRMIEQVLLFLEGKTETIAQEIAVKMQAATKSRKFEEAARLRDQLFALEKLTAKQRIVSQRYQNQDVMGYALADSKAAVVLFVIRAGKLIRQNNFYLTIPADQSGAEIVEAFLAQHYAIAFQPAPTLVLAADIPHKDDWSKLLTAHTETAKTGKAPQLIFPQRGERRHLVELANKNAAIVLKKWQEEHALLSSKQLETLAALAKSLGVKNDLHRLECFDVSHIQGTEVVAAMSVFLDGKPAPAHYRRFKIKLSPGKNDDYAALDEVLTRRLRNLPADKKDVGVQADESFRNLPDLMVIDGGKGQLSVGEAVLKELQLEDDIALCSLAKKEELIFLPGKKQPLQLSGSPAHLLLQQIRDEAHRFAITYHRRRRSKLMLHSSLDDIPGIGAAKRKLLLNKFGSAALIRQASEAAIAKVVGEKLAKEIKERL